MASAVQFPVSLRLNRLFSENLSHPESKDAEQLRMEVAENVRVVSCVGGIVYVDQQLLYHQGLSLFFYPVKRSVQADSWGAEGATDHIQVTTLDLRKTVSVLPQIDTYPFSFADCRKMQEKGNI